MRIFLFRVSAREDIPGTLIGNDAICEHLMGELAKTVSAKDKPTRIAGTREQEW